MHAAATHHKPGVRDFRRKYRLDGQNAVDRLRGALKTLEANEEAVLLGLAELGLAGNSLRDVKAVLRLLVNGP